MKIIEQLITTWWYLSMMFILLVKRTSATCTGTYVSKNPKFGDTVTDDGFARDLFALNTGFHILNPGGMSDLYEDSSGDPSCPIDETGWTCELRVWWCSAGEIPQTDNP